MDKDKAKDKTYENEKEFMQELLDNTPHEEQFEETGFKKPISKRRKPKKA
jgi:hypothetical protein